jgi:aspartyl-tRNA(Asn)/glutamyl-tRNA(Gln) amidotransferase subunit A
MDGVKKPETFVKDPGRVRQLAAAIADGSLTSAALVQACLDRIDIVQPEIEPWREVDGERALAEAERRDAEARKGRLRGPLHGIPVGVKDIIDVAGLPTRCNTRWRADAEPAIADAEVVSALKAAGAVILGKVHTTEYAFFDPSPARNPHNRDHTPGGSSSGSGAALASGTVPVTIGTQTLASVNRPAAYCGVAAFKPSTRSLSIYGVAPLSALFDTVGFFGWSVDDAVYAFEAVAPAYMTAAAARPAKGRPTIVTIDDPLIADAKPDARSVFEGTAETLRAAGFVVVTRPSPTPFKDIFAAHWSAMHFEIGRAHAGFLELPEDRAVGANLRKAIEDGLAITAEDYLDSRGQLDRIRREFFEIFADVDGFLWPATPGPAPEGLKSTGDPKYIGPWTALGGPIVTLPAGKAANGLPLGCILAGRPGGDAEMGTLARRVAEVVDAAP